MDESSQRLFQEMPFRAVARPRTGRAPTDEPRPCTGGQDEWSASHVVQPLPKDALTAPFVLGGRPQRLREHLTRFAGGRNLVLVGPGGTAGLIVMPVVRSMRAATTASLRTTVGRVGVAQCACPAASPRSTIVLRR